MRISFHAVVLPEGTIDKCDLLFAEDLELVT